MVKIDELGCKAEVLKEYFTHFSINLYWKWIIYV